ncbi:hypothetical protein ANCCAN_00449 [Ancylostoma caninum]|uniref:G-protein coupled receptors family 1 profile domain-containing protein n=1 Tax=Ancylostoma caninum TaxID=29170 RepID=A0A368HDT8_ANCCA|nr:hypothetical protein ANCCAN_00449 [Ancylostoma caninum]
MCLLGELVNVAFALSGKEIKQNLCFVLMSPYLVFICLQSTMFLVLALDILVAILFPLKHMVTRLWIYVGIASIPPVAYAVLILSMATVEMMSRRTNPKILLCNPPLSMDPRVTNFWINWNGFSNLGVLIIYVAVYAVVSNRDKRRRKMGSLVKQTTDRKVSKLVRLTVATFYFNS